MNPHIDAVKLSHAGRTAVLRFTWRALQVLQRDWGDDWRDRISTTLEKERIDDLSALVALLSGMSQDEVMDWSPPLVLAGQACLDAYMILKLGRKDAEAGETAAENPRMSLPLLSRMSAVWRSALASAGRASGAARHTQHASS